MTVTVTYPGGGPDVTRANKRSIIYLTTDPTANNETDTTSNAAIDGSIRFVFTPNDAAVHIEKKTSGVWNDTDLRIASASLGLGRDLKIGAAGGFIETLNISEIDDHLRALIPHIQFDNAGTTGAAHMPVLDAREDFVIFAGPATGETTATTIGQIFSASPTRLLHSTTHTTGATAATAQITVSYYKGNDNTGPVLNRFKLAASVMPASTAFTIVYEDDFGFENAENIFFEFTSTQPISLTTNAAGQVITTQNGHSLDELDIVLDELVLTNDLSLTFDNDLGFIVNNRF